MVANNNILTPFAFYTDKKYQDRYKTYGFGDVFPLLVPNNALIPFQIIFEKLMHVHTTSYEVYKVNADGSETLVNNVTIQTTREVIDAYVITHYDGGGITGTNTPLSEGRYYLKFIFHSGGTIYKTMYSEVFTVVNDVSNCLKLQWWDTETMVMDGGIIYYNDATYKNTLYIPTEVGKPSYEFEEEGDERNGYFFAEKQISKKRYQFNFLAPEYVCDALRLMRMHDYITIECNGITYYADQANVEVNWQTQGNLASVTVTFYCSTVAKKVGKMTPFLTGGDYNDDYNDDYNND